jgi:hypothetical protein
VPATPRWHSTTASERIGRIKIEAMVPPPRSALPELDDRLLAQCEGDWVSVPMAMAVLGSWFERDLSRAELMEALSRLINKGLAVSRDFLPLCETPATSLGAQVGVEFTATQAGIEYLAATRG